MPSSPSPLLEHVVRFELALRASGLAVNPANLIDFCQSLEHIDVTSRRDFHAAGRVTLVHRQEDLERFDEVFRRFWEATDTPAEPPDFQQDDAAEAGEDDSSGQGQMPADTPLELKEEMQDVGAASYSGQEILMQRDLAALTDAELSQARRMLASLVDALASERGRRYAPNDRGNRLDFGRMLRRHSLHSPECMRLLFRRKKIRKPRLILLCDISGSMESYSRFLIEFIFALRRTLPRVEVGVFATRMTMITRLLEERNVDRALAQVTREVRDWGGGTDIGGCLGEFNAICAEKVLRAKTVAVILSDGWDCGEPQQLRFALEQLRRRVHRLLWLNPLLGGEGYQPLCAGIRTALHYIDEMLPAHNLESLVRVARVLREVWH
jgi:uncharacterized protein with von Willebrand factor type A (vWA) domain